MLIHSGIAYNKHRVCNKERVSQEAAQGRDGKKAQIHLHEREKMTGFLGAGGTGMQKH